MSSVPFAASSMSPACARLPPELPTTPAPFVLRIVAKQLSLERTSVSTALSDFYHRAGAVRTADGWRARADACLFPTRPVIKTGDAVAATRTEER
jgi:hypothetical protein